MSWEQWKQIVDEELRDDPPSACPNDGTPLEADDGFLFCPFDFWQWPRDASLSVRLRASS